MKGLIIYCHPAINYLVSTDVISQYLFFKRAKKIFNDNNIEILYFYDLLEQNKKFKYENIEENYKYSENDLITEYKKDCIELRNKIINNYLDYILVGLEPIGFDQITNYNLPNKKILSIYDPHGFYIVQNRYNKDTDKVRTVLDKEHIFTDKRLDEVNLIVSPSVLYFKNINSNYFNKCRFISFSYNEENNKIFSIQNFESFFNRKKLIVLQGANDINYKYRNSLFIIKNKLNESINFTNDFINFDERDNFSELLDILPYSRYNRSNSKYNDEAGLKYLETLSQYQGSFIFFAIFPINFILAKVFEVMLAGCIAFIEPNESLKNDLGLIEYKHYVPVLMSNNKMVLDINYYNKYLGTDEGLRIAKNGFNYIKNNFTDNKIALNYINILSNL
jgi:hypothetical protein